MIGDIIKKMAQGMKLTYSEIQYVSEWANLTEDNNMFTKAMQNGSANISVNTIRANYGTFEIPPTGIAVRLKRNSNLTVATGATPTELPWEYSFYANSGSMWNSADPNKIYCQITGKYQVFSYFYFSPNATGVRTVQVSRYTSGGVLIENLADSKPAYPTGGTILNVVNEFNVRKGEYIVVRLYQTSGGDLDLQSSSMTIRLIATKDNETA